MSGSAFNAFKAKVPVEMSQNLYKTLVRGLPGTRQLHRRTLEAIRLRHCNRTVVHHTFPPRDAQPGEEIGGSGDRGDVQCKKAAGGAAQGTMPSYCYFPSASAG